MLEGTQVVKFPIKPEGSVYLTNEAATRQYTEPY